MTPAGISGSRGLVLARLGGQAGCSSLSAAGLYGRAEQSFLRL